MDVHPLDQRPLVMAEAQRGLPRGARRLLAAVVVLAAVLAAAALLVGGPPTWPGVLLLAGGMAGAELLRVDLPHRRGGTASFGLSDAALAAGLLLLAPADVVLGVLGGMVVLQAVERVPAVKFATNAAQFTAGAAAAALLVHALAPPDGAHGPVEAGAVVAGVLLFLAVNAVAVGGMIALTGGQRLPAVLRALLPTGALLALGDTALAVIAVVLADGALWALPGLLLPAALLVYASRQAVGAQVDRQRAAAVVEVEHTLGTATGPAAIGRAAAAGAATVVGVTAHAWLDDHWITDVPEGAGRCPVDGSLATALRAPAAALGLPLEGGAIAIGLGGTDVDVDGGSRPGLVLVLTAGDLPLDDDAAEWAERLALSCRVHVARAAAGAALQQERATLAAVVHGTGDGVLLLAPDGTVAIWNPAMAALSGVAAEDALGRPVEEVLGEGPWRTEGVHDVDRQHADAVWRVSVAGVEDRAITKTGRLSVVAVHDVTADRRASRARDDMLAIVSHELRTPLTPIVVSTQMLRRRGDRLDPAQRDALLDQVLERADHLTRLVDDLLLVGQLSSGGDVAIATSPVPLRVGDLVHDAVRAHQLAHPDHEVRVEVGAGCTAMTDPLRLRQVIDNLVDNACTYSPAGSVVRIGCEGEGTDLVLMVEDEGRGIPPADLERVFERFTRVEDPLVMTTSGAGLGLYIVRALVRALGGDVAIRSEVGVGTTVTVRLPRLVVDDRVITPLPARS